MNLSSARLTLKHHRFEVGVCLIACLALAAAGVWINSTLLGFQVPPGCFEEHLAPGGASAICADGVRGFADFMYQTSAWFDPAMFVLPFAAGALVGVSIVGRELESRTAQTAWYLSPSRSLWLFRQAWPVVLIVGAAVSAAALSAAMLHETRSDSFPPGVFEGLGFHGPLVAARALLAFAIALIAGTVVGRSLPALVLAVIACAALLVVANSARQTWVTLLPSEIIETSEGGSFVYLEDMFRAPDGALLTEDQAYALVPPQNAGEFRDWLQKAGYVGVYRGIREINTRGWEAIEIAGTVVVGAALLAVTFPLVGRRRPL